MCEPIPDLDTAVKIAAYYIHKEGHTIFTIIPVYIKETEEYAIEAEFPDGKKMLVVLNKNDKLQYSIIQTPSNEWDLPYSDYFSQK